MAFLFAWALTAAAVAHAEPNMMQVSIGAGPLPTGLQALERQTGIELLFDRALVSGFEAPAIDGKLSIEAALKELLVGTNLTVRRAESGAWILERPAAAPLERPDAVVPEILVVSQRTQNADIRRSENDVQPYKVATQSEIVRAHRDNLDQFFTSRVTANTQVVPAGLGQAGDTTSEINLRGLGSDGTLVLIDGRRMPPIPVSTTTFGQSDINSVPLHAIKRIEVLTGAAGGIYGFGALGGVVNVVLDRDTRGVELHVTEGISSRGDGFRQGFEAKFGHTSKSGATDFVVFAAHNQTDTVRMGARDYELRDRLLSHEFVPDLSPPHGNVVKVENYFRLDPTTGELELNPDFVFKPQFGGARLPSHLTFVRAGFSGSSSDLIASLTQHAGQLDFSLTDTEARSDYGSNPRTDAVLANIRHRFGPGLEAFADAVVLRGRGESRGDAADSNLGEGSALIAPESPVNPFIDYINVTFPVENLDHGVWKHIDSTRYTGGLVAELPRGWRGNVELTVGTLRRSASAWGESPNPAISSLFLFGEPSDLDMNPFGDWAAFQRFVSANPLRVTLTSGARTQFRDQSLRFAGPVFSTAAGPATLTVLAEHRTEYMPGYTDFWTTKSDGTTTFSETSYGAHDSGTTSLYTELRSRLLDGSARLPFLRGLELQLAIRRDDERDRFPMDSRDPESELIHAHFTGTAYTAGAKISPTSWLMLRGSYATGEQPPPLSTLVEFEPLSIDLPGTGITDPKRGGTDPGIEGEFFVRYGGDPSLKAVRASTVSLGAVITPTGDDGPRIAVDYSRIRRTRDIVGFLFMDVVDHEDAWPERIERAPLTDADRAKGYTAGLIKLIDTRTMNGASLKVDAFDLHADWPLMLFDGRVHLYADATYHMHNTRKEPFQPDIHNAGFFQGPLKWRANGGLDWSMGGLTVGANLQYFDRSSVTTEGGLSGGNNLRIQYQGSRYIPSQTYLDLYGSWRLPVRRFGPMDELTVDVGVANVLDRAPPREADILSLGPGYSRYGDPRQRRFELGVSSHF